MSYVNAGPRSVVDGDPLDTPNGAVTSAGFNNFDPVFTANFNTDWMLGWNYFPNNYADPANAMVRFRLQPGSGQLNVIMATREAGGDFVDRVSGSIAYTLGDDIALQVTRNEAGLISLLTSGSISIVSATPPHPIVVNEGLIHWGNTTPGSDMVLKSISYIEAAPANSDPVLDTPQADISVVETTSGVIADISSNVSDADLDTLTYSVSPALPAGMTLNTTTGVISGNGSIAVTAAADHTFTADDGNGGTPATDVVSIEVTAVSAETIALIVASLPAWSNFLPGTHTISVEWDGGTVTFDHEFTLPAGWSIIQSNGYSGTVLAEHAFDTYGITLTSSDFIVTEGFTADAAGNIVSGTEGNIRYWDASQAKYTTESVYTTTNSQPTIVPTINNGGVTSISIDEGDTYSDPAWTWADDVVSGQDVSWSGDVVDPNTPGVYTRTASASNSVGSATPINYIVTVVAASANLPTINGPTPPQLEISLSADDNILFASHAQVQAWMALWSAVDVDSNSVAVSFDVPASMNVLDSPVSVTVTAIDSQSRVRTAQTSIVITQLSATHSAPLLVPGSPSQYEQRGGRFYEVND